MKKTFGFFWQTLLILIIAEAGFSQTDKETSLRHIRSNIEFLADDILQGRDAASEGERIASLYIAKEFQKYGIEPFGDNGAYFQNFELYTKWIDTLSGITLFVDGGETKLKWGDDFLISKFGLPHNKYSGLKSNIVFAGYGITSEELDYDDYKNLDVKGKVIIVFSDLPKDTSKFHPVKHRRLAQSNSKRLTAQNNGAAGIIIFPSTAMTENWTQYAGWSSSPSFSLNDSTTKKIDGEDIIPTVILSEEGMNKLLSNEKYSYNQLKDMHDKNNEPEHFELSKQIQLNYRIKEGIAAGRNVVGILRGKDDRLKNEFVTIGAHYDHVGHYGNKIFNGADDNASGTTAVMEAARMLKIKNNNRRSIVFALYTAEEKGLLGSRYLSNNSSWIDDAVVNINLDMVGRESIDSIHSVGADKLSSQLHEIVEEVNSRGKYFVFDYTLNDPEHPQRIYWRSDHVNFVLKNIPSVFFFDNMKDDYHKETDTAEKINFEKIHKVSRLVADTAIEISNQDERLKVDKQ